MRDDAVFILLAVGSTTARAADDEAEPPFAIIAFLIAVLTGLHTYYLGQPFFALKDYVGLFLWAVGTKVVVDTINTALQFVLRNKVAGRFSPSSCYGCIFNRAIS